MDLAVFPEIKVQLKGQRIMSLEELTHSTYGIIRQFDSAWYQKDWCLASGWNNTESVLCVQASALKLADLQRQMSSCRFRALLHYTYHLRMDHRTCRTHI